MGRRAAARASRASGATWRSTRRRAIGCVGEWACRRDGCSVLLNFVDLDALPPRGPLPARPARALVFSNDARAARRATCDAPARAWASSSTRSARASAPASDAPETLLGSYDLVFAKGRCAIEALATGVAVVLVRRVRRRSAGDVGTTSSDLQRINFGLRALRQPLGVERFRRRDRALRRRPTPPRCHAACATRRALVRRSILLVDVYERVVAEQRAHRRSRRTDAELRFMSAWLARARAASLLGQSPRAIAYAWARRLYFDQSATASPPQSPARPRGRATSARRGSGDRSGTGTRRRQGSKLKGSREFRRFKGVERACPLQPLTPLHRRPLVDPRAQVLPGHLLRRLQPQQASIVGAMSQSAPCGSGGGLASPGPCTRMSGTRLVVCAVCGAFSVVVPHLLGVAVIGGDDARCRPRRGSPR